MDVKLPDGTVIQGVPDNITKADLVARLERNGYDTSQLNPPPTTSQSIKQGAGNLAAGLVRGAGSIGATLLAPVDAAARALNGGKPVTIGGFDVVGQDRRAGMDAGLSSLGAETDSLMYKGGKLTGEIAGTAGAGGAVANGLVRAAPMVAKAAPAVANLMTKAAPAIQSGGLSLGSGATQNALTNAALRVGGGAVNGAVSAGMVDPRDAGTGALIGGALPVAVKVAGATGKLIRDVSSGAAKNTLGVTTGAGAESVRTAYKAGKDGASTFLDNMRGNVPMTDVLDSAKAALGEMRKVRSDQYKAGMAGVTSDKTIIDFAPIDKAVASLQSMGNYKGQVINKNSAGVVDEISGLVNQWKGLDPAEFHTPEGLDALKQAISDIRDTTEFGTAARKAADSAYNAVKGEITAQAPTYSKVMKDYSQASETLAEVERALSLGNKAAADTSMRKLQSLMRNNVNTNFGNRLGLAKTLEDNGADILPAVAGQAMSSWTPRGLQAATSGGALMAAIPTGGTTLAALPFASPRLIGELAYGLGSASRGVSRAGGAVSNKLTQAIGAKNVPQIDRNKLAALLATGSVLAANQK